MPSVCSASDTTPVFGFAVIHPRRILPPARHHGRRIPAQRGHRLHRQPQIGPVRPHESERGCRLSPFSLASVNVRRAALIAIVTLAIARRHIPPACVMNRESDAERQTQTAGRRSPNRISHPQRPNCQPPSSSHRPRRQPPRCLPLRQPQPPTRQPHPSRQPQPRPTPEPETPTPTPHAQRHSRPVPRSHPHATAAGRPQARRNPQPRSRPRHSPPGRPSRRIPRARRLGPRASLTSRLLRLESGPGAGAPSLALECDLCQEMDDGIPHFPTSSNCARKPDGKISRPSAGVP